MKQIYLLACAVVVSLTLLPANAARGQALRPDPAASIGSQDAAARSRDLARLFNDVWQDKLKHNPEYATYLGDKRYDAELTDYSPRAVNDGLARERGYIERLAAIEVQDNGSGFSAEAAKKVPAPFYTTRNVGLGLGLAVTQKIIENHHGKLEIVPSPSGIVRVSLPIGQTGAGQS